MKTHRLAMIGARGHYGIVLRELPALSDVELVAISSGGDTVAPLMDWCVKNARTPEVFDDYRNMLDDARPDIAVVCGPFELHAQMCIDAISRGIHVFAEKPVALTLDHLSRVHECCAANPNVHLGGMMQSRYDPGFYTAHTLIQGGAVGDVRFIEARKSYRMGARAAYFHDRAVYGGTIPWVGSHGIDWIMFFTGLPFESVYARQSALHNSGHGTMESTASCTFTLPGGRIATVSMDVLRPATAPTHGDDWARIVGSTGVMEVRPGELKLINSDNDGSKPVAVSCDRTIMRDFVDHIGGEATSLINTKQTLDLTEACLLARQSADEGRIVTFQ